MQLGVLVDRPVDARHQPGRFQRRKMLLEVERGAFGSCQGRRACRADRAWRYFLFFCHASMIGLAWRKQSTPHGNAAIDRDLDQHRADLVRRHAVVERAAHVGLEFLHAAERCDHAEVEDRALARRQRVVAPGLAPAVLRDDALEVAVEVVDIGHRLVDVFIAGDLAAHLHADVVGFLVHEILPLIVFSLPPVRLPSASPAWSRCRRGRAGGRRCG